MVLNSAEIPFKLCKPSEARAKQARLAKWFAEKRECERGLAWLEKEKGKKFLLIHF